MRPIAGPTLARRRPRGGRHAPSTQAAPRRLRQPHPAAVRRYRARYTGLEYSQYLCERLGWQQGSIADWPGQGPGGRPFDLVVCYDVMQYLGDRQARTAIANLARLCGSVLHFNVLTRLDWEQNCDRLNTDGAVYIRSGGWYRRELGRGFANAGSCLYLRHGAPVQLWELEGLDRPRGRVP